MYRTDSCSEFDESHWDTDEEIDSAARTGLGENKALSNILQEQKVDAIIGDTVNTVGQPKSVAKTVCSRMWRHQSVIELAHRPRKPRKSQVRPARQLQNF